MKVGAPLSKIKVIPNGLRDPAEPDEKMQNELEKRLRLKNGFILNVGGIHERKNIIRLVRSFAKLVQIEGYTGNLIITGSVSGAPYQEKMKKMCDATIAEVGMENRIIFTGFVSEKELDILLRIADVFVYPSLYEGFGIPILEAMKLGAPVITSNVTAMPEVAGDFQRYLDLFKTKCLEMS
jgi:glycosyltransferase involved in cell wall biosynthesis